MFDEEKSLLSANGIFISLFFSTTGSTISDGVSFTASGSGSIAGVSVCCGDFRGVPGDCCCFAGVITESNYGGEIFLLSPLRITR